MDFEDWYEKMTNEGEWLVTQEMEQDELKEMLKKAYEIGFDYGRNGF